MSDPVAQRVIEPVIVPTPSVSLGYRLWADSVPPPTADASSPVPPVIASLRIA